MKKLLSNAKSNTPIEYFAENNSTNAGNTSVDTQNIDEYNEDSTRGGINGEYTENNNRNAGTDTELLARGEISTVDTYEDSVWKYGPDTAELLRYLGDSPKREGIDSGKLRAGSSGWAIRPNASASQSGWQGLDESFLRGIQGIAVMILILPSGKDTMCYGDGYTEIYIIV